MPLNRSIKKAANLKSRSSSVNRKPFKTNGTRAGILEDWRSGSAKTGRMAVKLGKSIRDGR